MGRLPRRDLGAGVYHIYNRCANNLWILDSQECKDKFLELKCFSRLRPAGYAVPSLARRIMKHA